MHISTKLETLFKCLTASCANPRSPLKPFTSAPSDCCDVLVQKNKTVVHLHNINASRSTAKHSRLHVEDVFDALWSGCARRLGGLPITLLGPGHLDLLPGALRALCRCQRGGRGCGAGWGCVVMDELDLGRGGNRGRSRL